MTEKGAGAAAACRRAAGVLFLIFVVLVPGRAAAEKVLTNADGWQVFSDGRAGAFASYSYGDGHPTPVTEVDAAGNPVTISQPLEGGFRSVTEQQPFNPNDPNNAGKINIVRIRSGFISNVFGFGEIGRAHV